LQVRRLFLGTLGEVSRTGGNLREALVTSRAETLSDWIVSCNCVTVLLKSSLAQEAQAFLD